MPLRRDDLQYWIVWPNGRRLSPEARKFVDWIIAQAESERKTTVSFSSPAAAARRSPHNKIVCLDERCELAPRAKNFRYVFGQLPLTPAYYGVRWTFSLPRSSSSTRTRFASSRRSISRRALWRAPIPTPIRGTWPSFWPSNGLLGITIPEADGGQGGTSVRRRAGDRGGRAGLSAQRGRRAGRQLRRHPHLLGIRDARSRRSASCPTCSPAGKSSRWR